jgi:AcrR family transcriptional regulator
VLASAIELADAEGIDGLTMRALAQRLGVEAMSLYHHVANKQALLDGVVDAIIQEIEHEVGGLEVTPNNPDWLPALRERILAARRVMLRHPWVPPVVEAQTTLSPTMLRYMNSILGILFEGGVSHDLGHHGIHALGSRALGFSRELFAPSDAADSGDNEATLQELAPQLPYIVGMLADVVHDDPDSTLGWCDDQTEFEFGLDLILEGIAKRAGTG